MFDAARRLHLTAFFGMLCLGSGSSAKEPTTLLTIPAHKDTVRAVAFSPDGRTLATGGYDSTVRLWTVQKGDLAATLQGHSGNLLAVAFSPDGKSLASGAVDSVRIWDAVTQTQRCKLEGKDNLSVAFSPRGDRVAIGGENGGRTQIVDAKTGVRSAMLDGQPGDDVVLSVAYSSDGKTLATASMDMQSTFGLDGTAVESGNGTTITLWAIDGQGIATVARRFTRIVGVVWQVAFSPDGKILAAATEERSIRMWDVSDGKEKEPLKGHTDVVHGLAFSPDGLRLASASMDKTLKLWDASSGKCLETLTGHASAVKCVAFSPDGKILASGSWDGTAKLWDVDR